MEVVAGGRPEAEGGRNVATGGRDVSPGGREVLREGVAESTRWGRLRSGLPGLTAKRGNLREQHCPNQSIAWPLHDSVSFSLPRSIVEAAIPPRNHLTEQAKFPFNERAGRALRSLSPPNPSRSGLAASDVAPPPNWPIVIGHGEERTE